ncbi:MAG: Smr/MutS family protein, partial [Candidatus Krumholzibacteria bacterium]|nr:Smr/MutS family protein [Candidatus Krumholzibacteria bacterium]
YIVRIGSEGAVASGEDLARICAGEISAREVYRHLKNNDRQMPLLSRYRLNLSIQERLIEDISRAIGPDFEVLDKASATLSRIRRQIGVLRGRLRKDFADFAARVGGGKGYEFVTIRGERYVVSLPRAEAARIKGIVHHESASGASLYLEPLEFVDSNNKLESLVQEERGEVERILKELTRKAYEKRQELLGNQDVLLSLDIVSAKASFAGRFACIMPEHSSDGTLALYGARHPLLENGFAKEGKKLDLTPLDLRCEPDLKALVISGPNAGGKTVALKTIGLLVIMDRAGFLIPCRDGTVIPDYKNIFVDIGDDQSIEKSLSTFSSRIVRLKKILELVNEKSLVLIDEIGDGTDPDEGAALAEAVLDQLIRLCGRAIVTTHLRSLKGWAHETPGAVNATLDFDSEKIEPLFKLRMGVPGRSWGIEMAARLGLNRDIVERAKRGIGAHALRLEELLAHLERTDKLVSDEREELLKKERILSQLVESYSDRLDRFRKDRDELVQKAREEALDIVSSTRREMESIVREIRCSKAERSVIHRAGEQMGEKKAEFKEKLSKRITARISVDELKIGRWVEIVSLGQVGRVLSVRGSSRVFLELKGGLRVDTRIEDLSPTGQVGSDEGGGRVSWTTGPFDPVPTEIMVRGMDREEALENVDAFIDRAVLQGLRTVRIIHGIGKGILKLAIYDMLNKDPRVEEVHPGEPAFGGDGVAIVRLK